MNDTAPNPFFIEPESLAKALDTGEIKVIDGSWYLPAMNRDPKAEYAEARIPGARYFDIDAIADTNSPLPHMLPTAEAFASAMGKMGVRETDDIVVYDGPGLFSAARVWWTLRIMGAKNVRILAGGFDRWKEAGLPVETGEPSAFEPCEFKANFDKARVADFPFMLGNIKKGETLVIDARPYRRFTGEDAEPRPGLKSGHIPGSRSLPALDVIQDGRLLPVEELEEKFRQVGVDSAKHVTTTCGSGVTAAILSLALESTGRSNNSLYDGSWSEWGAREDAPVARWE